MARLFVTSINLNKNELQNARIQNLSSAPQNPVTGQIYYDTTTNVLYFWNSTEWIPTSGSTEVIQDVIGSSVIGGTGLTATYDDNAGTTTIDLDNTAVTAGSYGSTTKIPTFTVDEQGRLTAADEVDVATNLSIAGDTGTDTVDLLTDTLTVSGGEGIDVAVTDNTITISAEDASNTNKGVASFDGTDFVVTDGNVQLNVDRVEDIAGNLIVGGTGIDATYDDGAGSLTIDIDSTVVTKDGIQTLTNKTLGSGTSLDYDLDASGKRILNVGGPLEAGDAVNKAYVDAVAEGLHIHEAARVLLDDNVDLTVFPVVGDIVDGITLAAGDRVLVNGQTNQAENGIYVVQSVGPVQRALDFDSPTEVKSGDFIFVSFGTLYSNTGWVQVNQTVTIGTSPISFTQFSGAGTYLAGAGLSLDGNTFSVDVSPVSGNPSLTNTGGAVEVKLDTDSGLTVNTNGVAINNGTGLVYDVAGALTFDTSNGYGTRKLAFNVGNGAASSIVINHGLGTRDTTVHVYENVTPYSQVETDVEHTDSNNTTLRFAVAPATDEYRVVIVG